MISRKAVVIFLVGLAFTAPLVREFQGTEPISLLTLLVAIAGGIVAFFPIWQQYHAIAGSVALANASTEIDEKIQSLTASVSSMENYLATILLDERTLADDTEPGIAWKRINTRTTAGPYAEYSHEYKDSQYYDESVRRQYAIAAWDKVDKEDPIDMYYFLFSNPFHSLRLEAEQSILVGMERARKQHHSEFWKAVQMPFRVLIPLFPLLYYGAYLAIATAYSLTELDFVAEHIKGISEFMQSQLGDITASLPEEISTLAAESIDQLEQILKLILTVVIIVVAGLAITTLIQAFWNSWIISHNKKVSKILDWSNEKNYESVL